MDSGLGLILSAATVAAAAHSKQRRKTGDEPYINHPLRVAEQAHAAGLPAEAIAAALLHDTVEDTDLTLDEIREQFNSRVADLVHLLTQWWDDHAPPEIKNSEKPKYYGAILKDPDAINIKLLDRADNLNDMARMLPLARNWAQKYLSRSEGEVGALYAASNNEYCKQVYKNAIDRLQKTLARTPQDASSYSKRK